MPRGQMEADLLCAEALVIVTLPSESQNLIRYLPVHSVNFGTGGGLICPTAGVELHHVHEAEIAHSQVE